VTGLGRGGAGRGGAGRGGAEYRNNDRNGGHGRVCDGDRARVAVSHGTVEVKLLCFRWLSPFLKFV